MATQILNATNFIGSKAHHEIIRAGGAVAFIDRKTIFGNPFIIGPDGTREEVIQKYRKYFYERLMGDPAFKKRVDSLKGYSLGCFCKPLPCHGDVIAEYLDK